MEDTKRIPHDDMYNMQCKIENSVNLSHDKFVIYVHLPG